MRFGGGQGALVQDASAEAAGSGAPYGAQPALLAGAALEAAADCDSAFGGRQTAPGVNVILHEELALGALIGEGGFGKARAVHRAFRLAFWKLQEQHGWPLHQTVSPTQLLLLLVCYLAVGAIICLHVIDKGQLVLLQPHCFCTPETKICGS